MGHRRKLRGFMWPMRAYVTILFGGGIWYLILTSSSAFAWWTTRKLGVESCQYANCRFLCRLDGFGLQSVLKKFRCKSRDKFMIIIEYLTMLSDWPEMRPKACQLKDRVWSLSCWRLFKLLSVSHGACDCRYRDDWFEKWGFRRNFISDVVLCEPLLLTQSGRNR